ncbi:MAG: MFS transporter [Geminicoccaceae bacterium]
MRRLLKQTWSLLLGIAILMLGYGLQGTLLGVRASLENFQTAVTGIIMSGYYVGLLVGSLRAPILVARVGHVRVFAALLSLGSAAVLLHPVLIDAGFWFLLRFVTGYCFAGAFIVAESWLNGAATNDTRGSLLSVYMLVQMGALAGGQYLLSLADPAGFNLFILVSVLVSVAAVPMLLTATAAPAIGKRSSVSLIDLFRISPLGMAGVVGVGFAHSAIYAMGPVFAKVEGLPLTAIATFMASIVLGGAAFQWPIGRLSDRLDRRLVILAATSLTVAVLLLDVLAPERSWLLFTIFFCVGGLSLPLYAVLVAHTNDYLSPDQMVGASSALVLAYGVGAVIGPIAVATCMQVLGPNGFVLYLAAIHAAIGAYTAWRMTRRTAIPAAERGSYVPTAAPTTVSTALAQEARREERPHPSSSVQMVP